MKLKFLLLDLDLQLKDLDARFPLVSFVGNMELEVEELA